MDIEIQRIQLKTGMTKEIEKNAWAVENKKLSTREVQTGDREGRQDLYRSKTYPNWTYLHNFEEKTNHTGKRQHFRHHLMKTRTTETMVLHQFLR